MRWKVVVQRNRYAMDVLVVRACASCAIEYFKSKEKSLKIYTRRRTTVTPSNVKLNSNVNERASLGLACVGVLEECVWVARVPYDSSRV